MQKEKSFPASACPFSSKILYKIICFICCMIFRDNKKSRKHGNRGSRDFRKMPCFLAKMQ